MLDSKGRLFGKVSIVDILIVVIILGAVAGVGYKYKKSQTQSPFAQKNKFQVEFFGEEYPSYIADSVNQSMGKPVIDGVQGSAFGKTSDIKIDNAVSFGTDMNGNVKASSKPGYKSIDVSAQGEGTYNGTALTINNVDYYVGQTLDKIRVGNAELKYIRIKSIKKLD